MEATHQDSDATRGRETTEIEQLKEQLHQEHQMYLRALADFENYRKRVENDRKSAVHREMRKMMLSLLELADNFELALPHVADAPSSLSEGIYAIFRRLQNLLEQEGVTSIQAVNTKFDPRLHEAIESVHSDQYEPNTVVEEVQKGYRWGDELLRPARVRVAL
jgi:molecular chaperone GrpE